MEGAFRELCARMMRSNPNFTPEILEALDPMICPGPQTEVRSRSTGVEVQRMMKLGYGAVRMRNELSRAIYDNPPEDGILNGCSFDQAKRAGETGSVQCDVPDCYICGTYICKAHDPLHFAITCAWCNPQSPMEEEHDVEMSM